MACCRSFLYYFLVWRLHSFDERSEPPIFAGKSQVDYDIVREIKNICGLASASFHVFICSSSATDRGTVEALTRQLDRSLRWEVRALYLVPLGTIFYFIAPPVSYVFIAVAIVGILCTDTAISGLVTYIFVRPLSVVLHERSIHGQQRSATFQKLVMARRTTLIGAAIVVFSSTLLYVNMVLYFMVGGSFWTIPYLNFFVFAANADSVCNDVGLLLVC